MKTEVKLEQVEQPLDFIIKEGLTPKQIKQLLEYSTTDKEVRSQTSDTKRFKDRNTYEEWIKKRRIIYSMTDKNGNLLGIIWYGAQTFPQAADLLEELDTTKYGITFAIRIYEKARGKKLAVPFMQTAWQMFQQTQEYQNAESKGVWLETNTNNAAAVNSYTKFGYRQVTRPNEHGRIIMIQLAPPKL